MRSGSRRRKSKSRRRRRSNSVRRRGAMRQGLEIICRLEEEMNACCDLAIHIFGKPVVLRVFWA